MFELCEKEVMASQMSPVWRTERSFSCQYGCKREGKEGRNVRTEEDILVHLDNDCPLQKINYAYFDHGIERNLRGDI